MTTIAPGSDTSVDRVADKMEQLAESIDRDLGKLAARIERRMAHIQELVDAAPPIGPVQRERLRTLLAGKEHGDQA